MMAPLRLETLDHLNGGCSQLGAQRQCNTTGMEATGIAIQAVIIVRNTQFIDRSILTVIDDTGFSRISTILIIVHAQSRILIIVVYQVVIADAAETYTVLNIYTRSLAGSLEIIPQRNPSIAAPVMAFSSAPPACLLKLSPLVIRSLSGGDNLSMISPRGEQVKFLFLSQFHNINSHLHFLPNVVSESPVFLTVRR